jgi:hypothetical protein
MRLLGLLVSVVAAPFTASFYYEMYKALHEPKVVKKSSVWTGLSVVGWIVIAVLGVAIATAFIRNGDMYLKEFQKGFQEEYQKGQYKDLPITVTPPPALDYGSSEY